MTQDRRYFGFPLRNFRDGFWLGVAGMVPALFWLVKRQGWFHPPPQSPAARRWALRGAVFQLAMFGCYGLNLYWFPFLLSQGSNPLMYLHLLGFLLFTWCLYVLYIRHHALTGLLVTGPFRLTRHPMYFGLLLMDTASWTHQPVHTPLFYGLQAGFLLALVIAGYCQERETVARFGDPAIAYYNRTPRIPFLV